MSVEPLDISGLVRLSPVLHGDARGFFYESFNAKEFQAATHFNAIFVQDNHSKSAHGVLRGLHYQLPPHAQGKLVRVIAGEIFDVAVDLRRGSSTCGRWHGEVLSAENRHQLWIPPGFAHGFLVLSDAAEIIYKTTEFYVPQAERAIAWNDPQLAVEWPLSQIRPGAPLLSEKDRCAGSFAQAELFQA